MATLDDITLGDIELDPLAGLTLDDIEIQPAEGSGFWRQAADLPVSAAGGVITGLKGMTDLFGANNPVSQELASYQEFYRQSLSPEAQADQQEVARIMQEAQDKGVWEQVKAGARAFAVAPLDTAAQSLGTMAPIVATGVAGRALGLGAKGVQAVQAGAGAGMNTGIVKDSIYQDTKNFLLQSGKSEEEADRVALEAQSYGGQNIDQLLLAAGLGAADALFGAEKILGNAISKSGGRVTGGVVAGAVKTGVSEGIPEAAQGGQEAMAPNIALQREGYAVPTMRGVASSATMEGLSGFMAGAPVGAAEGMAAPMDDRNAPTMSVGPDASTFTPPPAADTVEVQETFGDATTAAAPVEEAAPAAEPTINPDDFEVVEEPGETIVTEPPAAPAFQFDLADDTTTAPDVDAEADVFSGVPQQQAPAVAQEPQPVTQPAADEAPTGGVDYYKMLGAQDAVDPARKRKRSVPQNFKLAYEVAWWDAKKQAKAQQGPEVTTKESPATATKKVATEMEVAAVDQSMPVPKSVRDGVIAQLEAELAEVAKTGDKGRQRVNVSIPGDGSFSIIRTEESIKEAITRLSKLSAPVSNTLPRVSTTETNREIDNYAMVLEETLGTEGAIQDQQAVIKQAGANTPTGKAAARTIEALQLRAEIRSGQGTPAQRSRRRIKNMTAQSGAIDLSIVEDLFEYGKTIYRAGMSFGKWAGQMVKEFGQGIASFLKQVFDRIVQAYKDSPYSDTTGAVGDVRPKAKPRQFEQKAKANAAVTEEAKAELGSEYIPITLEGTAEQAKALINESGLDAAEQRILDLSSDELTPTPIDFGIGLELTARLGAMGEHQRQARVVRIMSRRATSMGQTISVLAMLARLTPEGIVFYANQVIEQYIDTLPEERQGQIRAAQNDIAETEKGMPDTRRNIAHDVILEGKHGGEKIAQKIKRRIPDKKESQQGLSSVRSVLMSKATKAEATKQISDILQGAGISKSEADSLSATITSKFYKVLDEARRSIATQRKPKEQKLIRSWSKLVEKLNGEGMPDDDFIAQLSLIAKLPTMTPELGARLKGLTAQLKEAKGDQDMQLVIAGRIFEEIHSLVPVDFWVKVRAFSYIMMLFSPKTWIRNIGGNVIQFVANAGKDTAINVATGRAGIFSNGKTGDRVKSGRLKHLLTPYYDVRKGFEWNAKQNPQAPFSENLAAGIDHLRLLSKLTTQNKFEVADAKEVGRRIFSSKFMGMLETSLSIALGGPDRAFWKSALESSLANREARAKQMGEWTGRHTPEDIEGAIADAAGAIYQNANTISREAAKWRSSLNRMSTKLLSYFIPGVKPTEQFGFGTALMAFTQVPGAIARAAISWSPLGLITNLHQGMNGILWKASNQRAGKPLDTREFGEAFTKALGGTGIYAAGYYLYAMGVITASQEDDDDVEAMRRSLGMGQYRINVTALKRLLTTMAWGTPQKTDEGDVILSYDWAQPLAITFAAGAELAKMVEQNDRNGIKKGLAAKAAMPAISLAAGAKSLLDLPLLSGLSSFIDQLDTRRPESVIGAVARTVAGIPSMFVPQLVRQANQLLYDNTLRETRGTNQSSAVPVTVQRAFNQIAANTPGVADQFPPRLDVMGQAQERYQYVGWHWFNVLFNPALTSRVKANPVLEEAARLMDSTGETSQFPKQVKNRASINGQNIDLTNEQISAYQYYLGNYTASMMNWRMASPRYARLPDTEKVRIFAQDIEDVDAAVKSALFGHDIRRLTRRQRSMRNNLVNSPLGQSMPPR
jgi:DNA-binding protein YbaB